MSRRKEELYVFDASARTVKVPGHINKNDLLSIINITDNVIIHQVGEPGKGIISKLHAHPVLGQDPDFPWSIDGTCTFTLEYDTTSMSDTDELLIFIEDERKGLTTRPHDMGMDAMERTRTSNPTSLIDADFEYGLQSSKWQDLGLNMFYPLTSESTGVPFSVVSVVSDGASPFSLITVTVGSGALTAASLASLSVEGLSNSLAEGSFFIAGGNGTTTMTYRARGVVTAGTISTSYTVVRQATIYDGATLPVTNITFTTASTDATITFSEPHGLVPGSPIIVFDITTGTQQPYEGDFFVKNVINNTSLTYDMGVTPGANNTIPNTNLRIYAASYVVNDHRPFDGGVRVSSYYPIYGLETKRQTKRYFRYQAGKGIMFSTGTLLCPSYDIQSITYAAPNIEITVRDEHGLQIGAEVIVKNVVSANYNTVFVNYNPVQTYVVNAIVNERTFRVAAITPPTDVTGILGDDSKLTVIKWAGSCARTGIFDDANGMFWEYDGQKLYACRRNSTTQIAGVCTINNGSYTLSGSGTVFTQQLQVGDRIVIKGQAHFVTSITNDTTLSISPSYRGTSIVSPLGTIVSKVKVLRVPQEEFNHDTLDGEGPSGYNLHIDQMQMFGIQFTWYGAGYVDFMVRGPIGEWVMAHRMSNNNFNSEAYLRSGNLPARYEISNISANSKLTAATGTGTGNITLEDVSRYPNAGHVLLTSNQAGTIFHEVVQYSGKNELTNQLTTTARGDSYTVFVGGQNRTFSGSAAQNHPAGTSVRLLDTTCAPQLSHWGSSIIMDGGFDEDSGYQFTHSRFNIAIAANAAVLAFLFRPAPAISDTLAGNLGTRELVNRSRVNLQKLQINNYAVTGNQALQPRPIEISGILNPSNLASLPSWSSANTQSYANSNAFQPTFTQFDNTSTLATFGGALTGGELLFRYISVQGTDIYDLSSTKELQNSILGGDRTYPNGPETLAIVIQNKTGSTTNVDVILSWKEAQA